MPNSLLEALKLDLEQNFISVKTKENWQAICCNVILTIILSKKFNSDDFTYTTKYVNSKSKEELLSEIKKFAFKGENILDNGILSRKSAEGIVENIFELENIIQNNIISVLCSKIDKINVNSKFKEYLKLQIKEGTITDDELRRFGIVTEGEIQEYHNYFQSSKNFNNNYSK